MNKYKYDFSEKGREEFYEELMSRVNLLIKSDEVKRERLKIFNLIDIFRRKYESSREMYQKALKRLESAKISYCKQLKNREYAEKNKEIIDAFRKSIEKNEKSLESISLNAKEDIEMINKGVEEKILLKLN